MPNQAKIEAVKCVRDMRGYPPSFYRMDTDGRKWEHTCMCRRMLAMQVATYADGDGTNITVGIERLRQEMGWSKRTLYYLLRDLVLLGILENDMDELAAKRGKLTGRRGTRLRHINWEGVWERAAQGVQNSGLGAQDRVVYGVQNSGKECRIAPQGVQDSGLGVQDSTQGVQQTADFGPRPSTATPTALSDREILPPKAAATQQPVVAEGGGGLPHGAWRAPDPSLKPRNSEEEDDDEGPSEEETLKAIAEFDQQEWQRFMAGLPEVMQGAVLSEDLRAQLWAQVKKHDVDKLLAALRHWIEVRDLPVDGCRTKWRAWLAEADAAIAWVRQTEKRARLKQARAQAAEAANKAAADRAAEQCWEIPTAPAGPQPGGVEDYFGKQE